MRLDRPIGTWLLLFPCWWAVALASETWPEPWLLAIFAIGALVMRGAGCTYNDIVDRGIDGRVARTADRPIPSGAIGVGRAVMFLYAQLLVGLAILLTFNATTIALGVASLALVFTYPLMKRVTWWPQFFLGLAFNWGALMGASSVLGTVSLAAVLMYAAGIAWTLGYDTIYAHQDREDDALIGVKSSALRLGARTRPALFAFYGATIALLAACGAAADIAWPYFVALVAGGAHLAWQAWRIDIDDPADCLATFRSNRWFGWIMLAGIIAGRVPG
jgi:4-hydroxybenzoate polyprenyltransferase